MKTWLRASAIVVAVSVLWSAPALGQTEKKQGCDALRAGSPGKVEGQVVGVDGKSGKVTIRSTDGKTHEFQASPETIKDLKVGDRLEAQLRGATNC